MPNPNGNPGNSGGKPGRSGRKSAYQEKADAQYLIDFFFNEHNPDELVEMLKGNRSVAKQMLAMALAGNEKYTLAVFNKLFPDLSKTKLEVEGLPDISPALRDFAKALAQKLKDEDNE